VQQWLCLGQHYLRQRKLLRVSKWVSREPMTTWVYIYQILNVLVVVMSEDYGRCVVPERLANDLLDVHRGAVGGTAKELFE
jgi:hypothetical protein